MNDRLDESIHRCSYIFFPAPEYIAKRRSPGEIQKRARNHSFFTGRIHDLPSSSSSLTAVRFASPPCPHGPIDTGTCTSSGHQSHLLCRPPKRLQGTHIWPQGHPKMYPKCFPSTSQPCACHANANANPGNRPDPRSNKSFNAT